jgi:hypothetical protein
VLRRGFKSPRQRGSCSDRYEEFQPSDDVASNVSNAQKAAIPRRRGEWSNHERLAHAPNPRGRRASHLLQARTRIHRPLPDRRHVLADIGITELDPHRVDPTQDLAVDFFVPTDSVALAPLARPRA